MKSFFQFLKSFAMLLLRILLVIAIMVLIGVAGYFGKSGTKWSIPYIEGLWESKFDVEWQQRMIAGLAFETPKPLFKTEKSDEEIVKTRSLYSEMFNTQNSQFHIMLYHVCFKPGVPFSLDGAAIGMGNNLLEKFGKDNFKIDTFHTSISGQKAIKVAARGKSDNEKGYMNGIVVTKNTDMWSLVTAYTDKFPAGESFSERILSSITISSNPNTYHDSILEVALKNAKLTSKDIAKMAYPAVVTVISKTNSGESNGFGSGFFIAKDLIATNYHVIREADSATVVLVGKKIENPIIGAVAIDTLNDLAILKTSLTNATSLPVDTCGGVSAGDDVYAVGNPEGLRGTISSGIISAIRGDGDAIYQITAPISKGSSGGPVISSNGKVIGISVGILSSGQNLNFAIPSCRLLSLYQEVSEPVSLSIIHFKYLLVKSKSDNNPVTVGPNPENAAAKKPITASTLYWETNYQLSWLQVRGVEYSFSLHNNTEFPVNNVKYLVKFLNKDYEVIDSDERKLYETIRPGMAKRVKGKIDWDVFSISVDHSISYEELTINKSRVNVEILGYENSNE